MLRSQFEERFGKLHNQFYAMGQELLSQINRTVRALLRMTVIWQKTSSKTMQRSNEYEVKLEKALKWCPTTACFMNLRTVLTVLKTSIRHDGTWEDHAVSIAEATIRMKRVACPFC